MLEEESNVKPDNTKTSDDADTEIYIKNEVELDRNKGHLVSVKDAETDKAVHDIEVHEDPDEQGKTPVHTHYANDLAEKPSKHTNKPRWYKSKKFWWWAFSLVAVILISLSLVPLTRYWILNHLGVRASLSLSVIDQKSGRPISGVKVSANGQLANTDNEGKATIANLKLGKTDLNLSKRSFTTLNQAIIVGWGSNPYPQPFQLTPVGSQYNFTVLDWLSKKPIAKAEISDGLATAATDEQGKAVLQTDPAGDTFIATIKASGYLDQKITILSNDTSVKTVNMVPAQPDIFISKRSGKYDLYKRDVDGKNEVILLSGTGSEQDNVQFLTSPDSSTVALVSSREGKRDKNGNLINNLYMIDVGTKTVTKVPNSDAQQIRLLDWVSNKLVYTTSPVNADPKSENYQQIISYDAKQDKTTVIANTNIFNDVQVINGQIYYAPSSVNSPNSTQAAQLFRVNPDGSNKTVLLDQEVYRLVRSAYDKIQVNTKDNKWYEQIIGDNKFTPISGAPANLNNRIYVSSPNGKSALWIDNRDGKGVLLLNNIQAQKENIVLTQAGLGYPVRWLNDQYLLLRVSNLQETADYVYNLDGGTIKKVGDVTNLY